MRRSTPLDPIDVVPLRRGSLGYRYREGVRNLPFLLTVLLLTASLSLAVAVGL